MTPIFLVTELLLGRWRRRRYKFKESRRTGRNLRVIRRCWYNICFTLRPFLSKHCSWRHPCLAHWLKKMKSAACTKVNGKGDHQSQQLLIPYVTPEQVTSHVPHSAQEGTCPIASCSSTMEPFKLYDCAHASSQPKQQYAATLPIPSTLSYSSTKPFDHHAASGASHNSDWLTRKKPQTLPSVGTTNWLAVQQNHERRWSQSRSPFFLSCFYK